MSRVAAEVWTRLESSRPTGESLTARLPFPERTDRLFCAINAELQRHLLVQLQTDEQELHDTQSRGFSVDTKELSVHGRKSARYLVLACHDASGNDVLDLIGDEVSATLAMPGSSPADVVHKVIAKWRRFWGQLPRHLLSREQQLGLFAELWFLCMWLGKKVCRWRHE